MSGAGMHPYHQQWAQTVLPPPSIAPPSAMPVEIPGRSSTDEVRTIFISGLPGDVKERELHNLLRWLPGFEASQINFKGEQPMGFALFSTAHHALAGKSALQDLLFDSETKSTLHTEMAKKNLFVKRGVGTDFCTLDQSKRMRTVGDYAHTGYLSPSAFHPQSAPFWPAPSYMAPPAPYDPYGGYVNQIALPTPPVPTPGGYALVQVNGSINGSRDAGFGLWDSNTKDNPPCNTLFVGNLGENVLEEELRSLFSIQPGYKQMKILRHERNTVCFIEFDDVNNAITVHQNLQGAVLPSSGRGGIRIQKFSKNPFGRRKDSANGIAAETNGTAKYKQ